mgnify:CR=1 FL=1
MKVKVLQTYLQQYDKDVNIVKDDLMSFRVFIYRQGAKRPITGFINRQKDMTIEKISDYPKQSKTFGRFPVCVVRVRHLRASQIDKNPPKHAK